MSPAPPAAGGVPDEILLARAVLSRVGEPACIPLWALVRDVGPVAAVEGLATGDVCDSGALRAVAARLPGVDPFADLQAAQRHGVRLVVPESDEWPHFAFACLERAGELRAAEWAAGQNRTHAEHGEPIPPLALWVRGAGDLASVGVRSAGVVGARSQTAYGAFVTSELVRGLVERHVVIVSGGAYGVDATAHRACLDAEGTTVIVSAGGLDQAYPATNQALFEQASATGLVVSESPVGAAPRRRRFLTRNRLIAALSTATVVVEASSRSGALNTAGHCFRLGRPVLAVPGPVTSQMSVGCHRLLRDERGPATLATGLEDVLALVGGVGDTPVDPAAAPAGAVDEVRALLEGVDESARKVFDGFPARRAVSIEELSLAAGVSPVEVIRAVPTLELAGLVEQTRDGLRIVPRSTRRPRAGRAASGAAP